MRRAIIGVAAIAAIGAPIPVAAQTVDQTGNRQEQRIRQGERSGQLTPREARSLNYRHLRLNRTEMRMRQRNGGSLTPQQRYRLRAMQRRDSAQIYRLKHNHRRDWEHAGPA